MSAKSVLMCSQGLRPGARNPLATPLGLTILWSFN